MLLQGSVRMHQLDGLKIMKPLTQLVLISAVAIFAGVCLSSAAQGPAKDIAPLSAGDLRKSGTVQLEVTCAPEVKEDFLTALALLHSFFYDEARSPLSGHRETRSGLRHGVVGRGDDSVSPALGAADAGGV